MTYSMIITRKNADPSYMLGIKSWADVTDNLKHKLDQWTIGIDIYKYSSNDRLLGKRHVTMGNLWEVANSLTDKILIN